MPRRPKFQPTKTAHGWCVNVPPSVTATGKREQHFFPSRDAAREHGLKLRAQMEQGHLAAAVTPSLAEAAARAAAILAPWGVDLVEAARIVAAMREAAAASRPLAEAVESWLEDCREHLRAKTLAGYRSTGKRLSAALGSRNLAEITGDELAAALMPPGTPATAARGHLRTGKAFWSWAAKKGWCDHSTVEKIEAPRRRESGEIEVLTPGQAEHLLRTAEAHHPEAVPHYALALFAGIRAEELSKLTAADVSPEGIELAAHVTKKGRRRHITPNATLAAWLRKHPFQPCRDWKRTDTHCRFLAGWQVKPSGGMNAKIPKDFASRPAWPQNALRHSHATYSIAAGATLETLLFEFGHTGRPDVLRAHYVGRASKKDALKFFAIMPGGVAAPATIQPVQASA